MKKQKYTVTRAHLKTACENKYWDLLDKLLEINNKHINDKSLFTDTWGEWWGLLIECIFRDSEEGVKVLLKHGAKKNVSTWGDCLPKSALEAAAEKPNLL